jgi:hypothetical protein
MLYGHTVLNVGAAPASIFPACMTKVGSKRLKPHRSYSWHFGSADPKYIKRLKKIALATLLDAEQIACFPHRYARVAASSFPILSGDL